MLLSSQTGKSEADIFACRTAGSMMRKAMTATITQAIFLMIACKTSVTTTLTNPPKIT